MKQNKILYITESSCKVCEAYFSQGEGSQSTTTPVPVLAVRWMITMGLNNTYLILVKLAPILCQATSWGPGGPGGQPGPPVFPGPNRVSCFQAQNYFSRSNYCFFPGLTTVLFQVQLVADLSSCGSSWWPCWTTRPTPGPSLGLAGAWSSSSLSRKRWSPNKVSFSPIGSCKWVNE